LFALILPRTKKQDKPAHLNFGIFIDRNTRADFRHRKPLKSDKFSVLEGHNFDGSDSQRASSSELPPKSGLAGRHNALQILRSFREQYLEFRLEAQNVFDVITYDTFGSQSIQSTRFTPTASLNNSPRKVQLSAKYVF
jgi:hypothetical protein